MSTYRIVVGIDGSEDSDRALRWAVRQARQFGGTVEAVMVYDWPGTEAAYLAGLGHEGERERVEEVLAEAVARVGHESAGVPIATEAMRGNAGAKLADAAADADLLVVGSHGHGRLYHAVLGSVAEACVRSAQCPVVVIPAPHSERARATGRAVSTLEQTT
jgi:nucleotide-binding universal stress UspA family protein